MTHRTCMKRQTWLKVGVSLPGGGFLFFGILVLVSLGTVEPAVAQGTCPDSIVSSDVTTDTTWTQACSPYVVLTDTLAIRDSATLTIEPGVEARFQSGAQMQIVDGGRLYAVGASGKPITFTSHITTPGPARSDWIGILINNSALTTTIEYATIEYAETGINIGGPSTVRHTIQHNKLQYNGNGDAGGAIYGTPDYHDISYNEVYSCSVGFKFNEAFNNTILSNTFHAIDSHAIWFFQVSSVGGDGNDILGNIIHNCDGDGIRWEGGDDNRVVGNMIYDCDGDGIRWENGNNNIIEENVICVTCFGRRYDLENLAGSIGAEGNWWGSNTPTSGVEITGTVDFTPWISLTVVPAHATLPADDTSTTVVTVAMNDGAGHTVPPPARTITLTASGGSFGTVTFTTVTLNNQGIATATFTAGNVPTTAIVTVTEFCGVEVTATIELAATNMAITKTASVTQTTPGSFLTYTISYSNTTGVPASNVWITDTLPSGTTYVTDTSGLPHTGSGNGSIGWYTPTLPGGAFESFVLTLTVDSGTCDTWLTNTVEITTTTADTITGDNEAAVIGIEVICPDVDLVVAKEDEVGPTGGSLSALLALMGEDEMAAQYGNVHAAQWRDYVYEGDVVTYTINVVNTGSYTATSVYVTETLPVNTTFITGTCRSPSICDSNTWSEIGSSGVYSMAVGTLPPDGGAVVEFIVRVTDTLPVSVIEVINHACAWSSQPDLNPGNNCASQQTPVRRIVMRVSKNDNTPCAFPGDVVVYTITYTNTDTVAQNDVVLTETLPDYTTYASGFYTWTLVSGSVYTYSVGTVEAGDSGTVNFAVQINDPLSDTVTAITNVVRISGGYSSTLVTPLPMQPDLVVVKNDNIIMASATFVELYETLTGKMYAQRVGVLQPGYVHPGETITYSIAYLNTGRDTAYNVVITETLPLHTGYVGYGWFDTGDGQHYTLSLGNLDPGQGGIVEFYVRVNDPLPAGVEWITNTVEIGSSLTECHTINNISTEETPVTGTTTLSYTVFLPLVLRNLPPLSGPTRYDIPVGAHPKSLVISEDHNRVYVTLFDDDGNGNPGGTGRLVVLNLAAHEVETKVPTGGTYPMGIAVLGDRLYVVNNGSNNVSVMDATSLAVLQTIPVGNSPFGVAATGDRVYVTNFEDGTLSIINAATDTVINTVTVGRHPVFPAAWGDCAYVPNHSGGEGVTVVCDDGADIIHRLREEWGYFAATFYPNPQALYNPLIILSRRDGLPGLYEISATPPYGTDKPVRKKEMLSTSPFAIAYNPTTEHLLVVAADNDELHIVWPGGYHTGTVWPLPQQHEGEERRGGQGVAAVDHWVWVANYAAGSVSVLYDPP